MKKFRNLLFVFLTLCVFPQDANANIGIPMIMIMEYWYIILFIPIVFLEVLVFKRYFATVSYRQLIKANTASNAFSTLIGVPITWVFLVMVEFGVNFSMPKGWPDFWVPVVNAPWLGPINSELDWMIPVAAMVLLIPFFFVSVWTEGWINKKFFKSEDPKHMERITRKANLLSYGFLYIVVAVHLANMLWKY
jgi:hypothetical protein